MPAATLAYFAAMSPNSTILLQGMADTVTVAGGVALDSARRISPRLAAREAAAFLISIIRIIQGR